MEGREIFIAAFIAILKSSIPHSLSPPPDLEVELLAKKKGKGNFLFSHEYVLSSGAWTAFRGWITSCDPPPSRIVKIARGFIARGTEPTDTREALFNPPLSPPLTPQSVRWRMVLTYAASPFVGFIDFSGGTLEKNAEQNGSAILREREKLDDRFGAILEKENFSKSVYFKRDQNEFPSYNSEYFEFSNTSILIIRNSFSRIRKFAKTRAQQ